MPQVGGNLNDSDTADSTDATAAIRTIRWTGLVVRMFVLLGALLPVGITTGIGLYLLRMLAVARARRATILLDGEGETGGRQYRCRKEADHC